MNKSLKFLFSLLVLIGISLPLTVNAGSNNGGRSATKPFTKIAEPTIIAVTDVSISTFHKKDKLAATEKGSGEVTKTYQISALTDILIDGKKGTVADLHPGMAVCISADPPSSLDSTGSSNAGVARMIFAHDAPVARDTHARRK